MHNSAPITRKNRRFRQAPLLTSMIAVALAGIITSSSSLADSRIEIEIPQQDREHCASRMRDYLEISNEILWASLEGDMAKVADTAIQGVPRRYRGRSWDGNSAQRTAGRAGRTAQQDGDGPQIRRGEGRRGSGGQHERMQRLMPEAYREMMHSMHSDFQQMAQDAQKQAEPQQIQRQLAQIQDICVACHATYKFKTMD